MGDQAIRRFHLCTSTALKKRNSKFGFPSKGPYDLIPLSTSYLVSGFRKVALLALWGFHCGFLRSGS